MKFPVVALSKDGSITVVIAEDSLGNCTKVALRNGYYKNLLVIDSEGSQFEVQSAAKIGSRGPFWGYDIFLGQKIKVNLEFSRSEKWLTLDEVKGRIKRWVNQDRYFWESAHGDIEEMFNRIGSSTSFEELLSILK